MFERFTESARRSLFFARYETSKLGGAAIEDVHLLLGLMRVADGLTREAFDNPGISAEAVRREIKIRGPGGERVSTSVEIPFSQDAIRILQSTVIEADHLGHAEIGPEHMLLGILVQSDSLAAQLLVDKGMDLGTLRKLIAEKR